MRLAGRRTNSSLRSDQGIGCTIDAAQHSASASILISDIKSLALQRFYCARIPLTTAPQAVLA